MVAPIRLDVTPQCLFVITLYQIETSQSHCFVLYKWAGLLYRSSDSWFNLIRTLLLLMWLD